MVRGFSRRLKGAEKLCFGELDPTQPVQYLKDLSKETIHTWFLKEYMKILSVGTDSVGWAPPCKGNADR